MFDEMIAIHSVLIKIFLAVLIGGIAVPYLYGKKGLRFKKAAFVYTMVFQAIATMVAFSGLVAMISAKIPMNIGIWIMAVSWVMLMFVEIKKYKLIKNADLSKESHLQLVKSAFVKVSMVEIVLVALVVFLKVMEAKGAISLS